MKEQTTRLLDSQFAKFLASRSALSGGERDQFQDLVCRLSMSLGTGDSCLYVTDLEKTLVIQSALAGSGEVEERKPLCIVGSRLYLQRGLEYEKFLAEKINLLVSDCTKLRGDDLLLDVLFGTQEENETDWQRLAAVRALEQNFLVISGGPGTGKTTTVVKILALLQGATGGRLRIALAAPTGKAAMRLQESIALSVQHLTLEESIIKTIPVKASTLHHLLGVKRHSPFFRHNAENSLMYDVVVVDEASMVDLALMSKLVAALRPGSRLILLGDKDQLASVESGTVLADMISALPENTVELQQSYRFDKGIKRFAEAINEGDSDNAWSIMVSDSPDNVSLLQDDVAEYGGEIYCNYMAVVRKAVTVEAYKELFGVFHSFTILCALRHGPAGVKGVNEQVGRYLTTKGYDCLSAEWYPGRPVMVTRNEYSLDLYNGDVGICLPDPENHEVLKVWFERTDGTLQGLLPGRLVSCETVYALTIHKSQGAEIGEVLVVLPDQESAIVTRELLYTAVTRARRCVKVKSDRSVFELAIAGKIVRHSGLAERLCDGELQSSE
jgi:exodeoxyribonuclease V alpha subunit